MDGGEEGLCCIGLHCEGSYRREGSVQFVGATVLALARIWYKAMATGMRLQILYDVRLNRLVRILETRWCGPFILPAYMSLILLDL